MSLVSAVFALEHGHEVPCPLVAEFEFEGMASAHAMVEEIVDTITEGGKLLRWDDEHHGTFLSLFMAEGESQVGTSSVTLVLPGEVPAIDVEAARRWVRPVSV